MTDYVVVFLIETIVIMTSLIYQNKYKLTRNYKLWKAPDIYMSTWDLGIWQLIFVSNIIVITLAKDHKLRQSAGQRYGYMGLHKHEASKIGPKLWIIPGHNIIMWNIRAL